MWNNDSCMSVCASLPVKGSKYQFVSFSMAVLLTILLEIMPILRKWDRHKYKLVISFQSIFTIFT